MEPATPMISTLSLHDALPILREIRLQVAARPGVVQVRGGAVVAVVKHEHGRTTVGFDVEVRAAVVARTSTSKPTVVRDRKSTRLNSSHITISYAVFCLKKKRK